MPPRARYNPEQILDAALALTRAGGIDHVTARNLASKIGCSTAPILTHFDNMDDLHEQLMDRIIAVFVESASTLVEGEGDPLVNAGVGWLQFAVDEPQLYEAVFLRPHSWHFKWGAVRKKLAARMAVHPRYAHLTDKARFALTGRASIVMHGLGVEIWSGRLPRHDPRRLIDEFAVPVIDAALNQGWTRDLHMPSN